MQFIVKKINNEDIVNEMARIGFDADYLLKGVQKHRFISLKIFSLSLPQANILKQTAISIGADCLTHREVITGKIEKSNVIISANTAELKKIAQKLVFQPFGLKILATNILDFCDKKERAFL